MVNVTSSSCGPAVSGGDVEKSGQLYCEDEGFLTLRARGCPPSSTKSAVTPSVMKLYTAINVPEHRVKCQYAEMKYTKKITKIRRQTDNDKYIPLKEKRIVEPASVVVWIDIDCLLE